MALKSRVAWWQTSQHHHGRSGFVDCFQTLTTGYIAGPPRLLNVNKSVERFQAAFKVPCRMRLSSPTTAATTWIKRLHAAISETCRYYEDPKDVSKSKPCAPVAVKELRKTVRRRSRPSAPVIPAVVASRLVFRPKKDGSTLVVSVICQGLAVDCSKAIQAPSPGGPELWVPNLTLSLVRLAVLTTNHLCPPPLPSQGGGGSVCL